MIFSSRNQTNRRTRAEMPDSFLAGDRRPQKKPPVALSGGDVSYAHHQFRCGFDPERAAAALLQLTLKLDATRLNVMVVLAEENQACRRGWQARHIYIRPQEAVVARGVLSSTGEPCFGPRAFSPVTSSETGPGSIAKPMMPGP